MVPLLAMLGTLAAQEPVKPLPAPVSQELPPGIRWSVALSAPPASPPVIAGDRVFVATLPGLVTVYTLADHQVIWRQPLNPEQPVIVNGDRLYVVSGEAVHAYNVADCSVAWRTPTGALTAPLLVKDGWIIAASATKLLAIRASDGEIIWSRDSSPQRQRPAISGDRLFVPLATGFVRAHDLSTGTPRWEWQVGAVPAEPIVVGDRVYVGATDKHFYSVRTSDGAVDWPIRVGAEVRRPAVSDGERIFYLALDNLVRAVNRSSGSQVWQQGVRFRPFDAPQVIGANVALAGPSPTIVFLNPLDGRTAGQITFPEPLEYAPAFGILNDAIVAAGITGGLTESWKLWLASPSK